MYASYRPHMRFSSLAKPRLLASAVVYLRPPLSPLYQDRFATLQSLYRVSLKSLYSPESPIKFPSSVPKPTFFSHSSSALPPWDGSKRWTHDKCDAPKPSGKRPTWRKKGRVKKAAPLVSTSSFPVVEVSVSAGMAAFIGLLHQDGYLKEDSFWKEGGFDPARVRVYEHSMGFLKFAVEQFGQKHQEIAKWLSGKHIKEIALLGCPSTDRKTVYAAKRLRSFFRIQENTVCKACKLRASCKFTNKSAGREEKLILVDVLFVLIGYSLPNPPYSQHYTLSDGMKFSIDKILTNVVNLSI